MPLAPIDPPPRLLMGPGPVNADPRVLRAMSAQLVGSFEADFTPEDYEDDYQVQLRKLVDAKLEAGETVDTAATFGEAAEEEGEGAEVVDLMEALKRSVADAKKSRKTG